MITYIGWLAMIITFIALYMFNKKYKYAPDAEVIGCSIWIIYGFFLNLPEIIFMNTVLAIVTLINYKSYKESK